MTPAQIIATLDAFLVNIGETVTLRRYTAITGSPRPRIDLTLPAFVRVVSVPQLVGEVAQTETHVSFSPTQAVAASWPLPVQDGDKLVIEALERNIDEVHPIFVANTLVRINCVVRG